ncbi:MAG: tetratricopeptide repeat protein [Phycisphaerales bacterium]|nr:tetratricopeptide repeat protein [Phycisphaerales bacterium]
MNTHRTFIAALLALTLAACHAGRAGGGEVQLPPGAAKRDEAHRLAAQAEDARKSGNNDRAIDLNRQSITAYPDLAFAWNNLGALLMGKQQNMDAVAAFKRAAELTPEDPRPVANIGLVYSRLGWAQKALEYYLKALDRDPRFVPALRGSVGATKVLALADDAALTRVRTALMADTDPDWRRIYEMEQSRIDGQLRMSKKAR